MPSNTIQGGLYRRDASLIADSINKEKRTAVFCWSTGARVLRVPWFDDPFYEELSMKPEHIRLHRLNKGAPFLRMHRSYNLDDSIGVHERAWIEGEKGFAEVRFSKRKDVEEIWGEVCDGILRNTSVGYKTYKIKETKKKGDYSIRRAIDWEPFENSLVLVNADADAQIRSSEAKTFYPINIRSSDMEEDENKTEAETYQSKRTEETHPDPQSSSPEVDSIVSKEPTKEAMTKARKLAADINNLCDKHGVDSQLRAQLIENAESFNDAAVRVLEFVAKRNDSERVKNPYNLELGRNEVDVRREAIPNALLHRHDPSSVELSEAGREYRGMNMMDLARFFAKVPQGRFMDKREIVTRAFSTSDFPELLADTAKRKLLNSYESLIKLQSYQKLVTVRSLPDFKETKDIRMSDTPQLVELPEGAEYKYGYQDLSKEGWHLVTFGRKMGITRQAVINDDLGAFDKLGNWGLAAARLEAFLFWQVFNENQLMGDGVDLFHAKHANIETKKELVGAPSIEAISSARVKMRRQKSMEAEKDQDRLSKVKTGRNLGLVPKHIIVPPELEENALKIIMPGLYAAKNEDKNPYQGYFDIIVGDELTDTDAWYMACDKSQGIDLIHMGYLDGIRAPYVEYQNDFDTDQVAVKARMDIACKAKDWKGLYKNPGKA